MADVIVDQVYGFTVGDSTSEFYTAIHTERGSGNNLIFRDMGSPWVIGAQLRLFDVDDMTLTFEPGCVVRKKLSADGGFFDGANNNIREYRSISKIQNVYPGGLEDDCLNCNPSSPNYCGSPNVCRDYYFQTNNQQGAILYLSRGNNFHVVAYGAEFIGVYPYDNPGTDPSTTPNARDPSYEQGHLIQFGDMSTCSWRGGYIHNFSGDGINIENVRAGHTCTIEDVKVYYCKRLGISHIKGEGTVYINDSDVSFNGKADVSPVWGTNTRQGITIEPNQDDETIICDYRNLRLTNNSSVGLGLNLGTVDDTAPAPLDMYFEGLHLEDNSDQPDYSTTSALRFNGTDLFQGFGIDGDNPLDGTAVFRDVACWGDSEGFMSYRGYDGIPSFSFDNTVIYKVSTSALPDGIMNGDAINEWDGLGSLPNGRTWANFDWGNVLCIHEFNEPFIKITGTNKYTEVASTVTGTLTIASPHTGNTIDPGGLTDNNTISKTQYTIASFPENVVSVSALSDAVKATSTTGYFRFSRTGSTTWPMAVKYSVTTSGTNAEHMVDFKLLRGSCVIRAGETFVDVPVVPLNPSRTTTDGQVDVTIDAAPDLYTTGTNAATVFLYDTGAGAGNTGPTYTLEQVKLGSNTVGVKYLGSNLIKNRVTS